MNQAPQADLFSTDAYDRFQAFHRENPRVFVLFELYTMQAINSGRQTYGAKAIMERIRWQTEIETRGDEFKVNNNYVAMYARLFAQVHPEHKDFFEFRNRS